MLHGFRGGIRLLLAAMLLGLPSTALAWLDPASPDVLVVPNTDDDTFDFGNGPPPTSGWWLYNMGKLTTSSLQGWIRVTGLRFDLSAHRGRTVERAELHLAKANTHPNFALVAATINTEWSEGTATAEERVIGSPCWRWRKTPPLATPYQSPPDSEWTFHYSDFSTTTFGSYGSLLCYAYSTEGTFDRYTIGTQAWVRMELDPALVQALILDQYGLAVTDARICYPANYWSPVYTKEQGSQVQPRLYIKFATTVDTTPPGPVGDLTAQAGTENGAVVLGFTAPADPQAPKAFGYTVRCSTGGDFAGATDVARWRIPRPKAPGTPQRILIEDLTPGATYTFFVQAYDAVGNAGDIRTVDFVVPAAWTTPTIPDSGLPFPDPAGKAVRTVPNVLRYWAASETAKINPATGNRIEDGYTGTGADDYKKANAVWDSQANTISMNASRNEVVGVQLILERLGTSLDNVQVSLSNMVNLHGPTISSSPFVEWFQVHYVNSNGTYYPDAAIPLSAPLPASFGIPDANHNPGGKVQSVWMDLYVPKDQPTGDYFGTITVSAAQLASPLTVNLKIHVSRTAIPDYPTFMVDLNGYDNPWDWGSGYDTDLVCLRYFQTAHKHRAMCNTLPYGWSAAVSPDRCPTLSGQGPTLHAADWGAFDDRYGWFFDGSAFTPSTPGSPYHGPGQGTPVTHFYTSFFESWPIHIQDPLYGFDAAGQGGAYWDSLVGSDITQFFTTMPDIYPAFPDGYKQGVRNVVADWFTHAHEKGWTRTNFQIYLNHKFGYDNCAALWTEEECESADDFRAVGFFHELYRQGQTQSGVTDVPWHFRIDISTRWSQHWSQLDNRVNFQMMGSNAANWHWPQLKYRRYTLDEDKQEQWNWYGLGTSITSSGIGHSQTFLQKWCQGFTGGMQYWDNYQMSDGGKDTWTYAHSGGLVTLYSGQNIPGFGTYEGPIASIRLKMMRQAEQIIELLNQIAALPGWSREKIRSALSLKYGRTSWDYSFSSLTENTLYQLRADLMALLETLTVKTGDFNGDGWVDVADLLYLVDSFGTLAGDAMYDPYCDTNHDGAVDVVDLLDLVYNFGT